MYICVWVCTHEYICLQREGRGRGLPGAGVTGCVCVSHLTWVLRIELKSSARAESALNHWAISLAPLPPHLEGRVHFHSVKAGNSSGQNPSQIVSPTVHPKSWEQNASSTYWMLIPETLSPQKKWQKGQRLDRTLLRVMVTTSKENGLYWPWVIVSSLSAPWISACFSSFIHMAAPAPHPTIFPS